MLSEKDMRSLLWGLFGLGICAGTILVGLIVLFMKHLSIGWH